MKKLLFIGAIFIVLACTSSNSVGTKAYICANQKTEVYHLDKACRALKRCTHEIKEVTKADAENKLKKRLCGYETNN